VQPVILFHTVLLESPSCGTTRSAGRFTSHAHTASVSFTDVWDPHHQRHFARTQQTRRNGRRGCVDGVPAAGILAGVGCSRLLRPLLNQEPPGDKKGGGNAAFPSPLVLPGCIATSAAERERERREESTSA
jgi:hypothetical protein